MKNKNKVILWLLVFTCSWFAWSASPPVVIAPKYPVSFDMEFKKLQRQSEMVYNAHLNEIVQCRNDKKCNHLKATIKELRTQVELLKRKFAACKDIDNPPAPGPVPGPPPVDPILPGPGLVPGPPPVDPILPGPGLVPGPLPVDPILPGPGPVPGGDNQGGGSRSRMKIASDFGSNTDALGRIRNQIHQGIDIIGPVGTEIIAIADGHVLAAEDEACWGPTIMIDHSSTGKKPLIALYGHLDEMLVNENEFVKRGQLIGHLGDEATKRKCVHGIRHLHLQLGRRARAKENRTSYWGYKYFLEDREGLNPHPFWADGYGKLTCFVSGKTYPKDKITWPLSNCNP